MTAIKRIGPWALGMAVLCGCPERQPCEQISDWHDCDETSHCEPTHEDPVDPDDPTFSCLPAD